MENESLNNAVEPLISIIVPCYNVEQYLPRCMNSILDQTYSNLEIWLVDDGSPDNCGSLCDDYAKKDNRIRVIHKPNGGLSDARNVAIDQATGEWITFVDSDDFIENDYIETLYQLVYKYNCYIAVAGYETVDEHSEPHRINKTRREEYMSSTDAMEQMFYQEKFDNNAWGKIYHRSLFESGIRYPKGLLYEDLATTYLLFNESNGVALTNKIVYYYLLRSNSIEGAYNPKKIQSGLAVAAMLEDHPDILNPIFNAWRCRIFSLYYHLIMPMPKDAEGRDIMFSFIKNNRWKILLDRRARKKARAAALISYLGFDITKYIFSFINKRNH